MFLSSSNLSHGRLCSHYIINLCKCCPTGTHRERLYNKPLPPSACNSKILPHVQGNVLKMLSQGLGGTKCKFSLLMLKETAPSASRCPEWHLSSLTLNTLLTFYYINNIAHPTVRFKQRHNLEPSTPSIHYQQQKLLKYFKNKSSESVFKMESRISR